MVQSQGEHGQVAKGGGGWGTHSRSSRASDALPTPSAEGGPRTSARRSGCRSLRTSTWGRQCGGGSTTSPRARQHATTDKTQDRKDEGRRSPDTSNLSRVDFRRTAPVPPAGFCLDWSSRASIADTDTRRAAVSHTGAGRYMDRKSLRAAAAVPAALADLFVTFVVPEMIDAALSRFRLETATP